MPRSPNLGGQLLRRAHVAHHPPRAVTVLMPVCPWQRPGQEHGRQARPAPQPAARHRSEARIRT
eukprot:15439236-Alexandrium_andersonii.AAC.1